MSTQRLSRIPFRKRGSAILAGLAVLAVTTLIVGAALSEARNRYRTSHHSSCWSQAGPAAEAGVELALMSAQANSWTANGWSAAPGAPGAAPVTKTYALSAGVTGSRTISADVSVSKIVFSGMDWLRIRSTGRANLTGGAIAGVDAQDVMLRKLSFRYDRVTGASQSGTPQATRMIEVLAEPLSRSPFLRPILMDKMFTMSGGWVDSFDSSDPTKSTNGLYVFAKKTNNGDVGINDTQGSSGFSGAPIYGDVAYTGTAPTGMSGVTGNITTPFTDPVQPVAAPVWGIFNGSPTVINGTMTLTGGTKASPARYKVSSLTVGGGKVLTLAPHAAGAESYVEIWVTGNFTTSGSGYITQAAGVRATYHIAGDVTVSGSSFNNQSNIAANNMINVISIGAASNQKVTVSGGGNFIGTINAPAAAFTVSGSASMSGAIIGKTMNISGGANVHYDEALALLGGSGGTSGYSVRSWLEGVR